MPHPSKVVAGIEVVPLCDAVGLGHDGGMAQHGVGAALPVIDVSALLNPGSMTSSSRVARQIETACRASD
jgi:hypothetical protein